MKKFVLIMVGFTKPTPEMMKDWMAWFESIGDKIESQVWLCNGKEITKDGTKELSMDLDALTGYLVINVENTEEAEKISQACPMITSVKMYEV